MEISGETDLFLFSNVGVVYAKAWQHTTSGKAQKLWENTKAVENAQKL